MFQILSFCVWLVKALTSLQPSFSVKNDNIDSYSESEYLYHLSLWGGSGEWEGEELGADTPPCGLKARGAEHPDVFS